MVQVRPITRRSLVKSLAAATTLSALPAELLATTLPHGAVGDPNLRFGVQLNAFPIDPKNFQTFLDALGQVKQIGYQGFESSFRFVSGQFGIAVGVVMPLLCCRSQWHHYELPSIAMVLPSSKRWPLRLIGCRLVLCMPAQSPHRHG